MPIVVRRGEEVHDADAAVCSGWTFTPSRWCHPIAGSRTATSSVP